MKVSEIIEILNASILCGEERMDIEIKRGFASDLMSDVLTLDTDHMVLITGLANMQTIRTVEMADIHCVLFVRNKQITCEMIELAKEHGMILLQCQYSMFNAVGMLYAAGLRPVY